MLLNTTAACRPLAQLNNPMTPEEKAHKARMAAMELQFEYALGTERVRLSEKKQAPPAKLPDACPHCGAAVHIAGLRFYSRYECGLEFLRNDDSAVPQEIEPCGAANPTTESQEDARQRSEKARADEWAERNRREGLFQRPGPKAPSEEINSPKQPTEQNTMATTTLCGPVTIESPQQIQPFPTPGSKWAVSNADGTTAIVFIEAVGPNGICVKTPKGKTTVTSLPDWNSRHRTQLPSKHDALRIPRRGPSRIKWFTVGAAACFFGRPFLPEIWSAVAGYVSRLM